MRLPLDEVDEDLRRRTIAGAYHIHTTRSDGADAKPAVASAAASAGLTFAIFADHSDGTRAPEPPVYIDGVLCIDAVEISTNGGHYVALGLAASPYPLGGDAAAVVEDVRRLGGFGVAAHPYHPRHELAWDDWTADIDGLEWLNADSEWRTEPGLALAGAVLSYLLRPAPALATVFDRPVTTLERWDAMSATRRVVALSAVDAHGARSGLPEYSERRVALGPSYEASFGTLTNRVILDRPLTGDAAVDARALLDAIARGRTYSVVDAISPDVIVDIDPARLAVVSPLPPDAEAVTVEAKGARRLEVRLPQAPGDPPVPWVLTNWIYPGGDPRPPEPGIETLLEPAPLRASEWRVEKDAASEGKVTGSEGMLTLRYGLAEGERANQFVAAAADLDEIGPFRALVLRGRASKPMRVSVQLRFRPNDARWVKSIYLDGEEREVIIRLPEMSPAESSSQEMPSTDTARSLLFVVDLVNARPGDEGEFTVREIRAGSSSAQSPEAQR